MSEKTIIQLGKMVKSFTLQDQFGQDFVLSKMKGRRVLLSFHPLAWTPVCTIADAISGEEQKVIRQTQYNCRGLERGQCLPARRPGPKQSR